MAARGAVGEAAAAAAVAAEAALKSSPAAAEVAARAAAEVAEVGGFTLTKSPKFRGGKEVRFYAAGHCNRRPIFTLFVFLGGGTSPAEAGNAKRCFSFVKIAMRTQYPP